MSAKSQRLGRIEGEMQRVLSTLVSREVRDPRVGNVTITTVSVAPDMSTARIFFVPFASKHTPEEVIEGLNRASGFLRGAARTRAVAAACAQARIHLRPADRKRGQAHAPHRWRGEIRPARTRLDPDAGSHAERHHPARQTPGAHVERRAAARAQGVSARRAPATSARSIPWPPACCRCASTRPPRSSPKSSPARSATNSPCSSVRARTPAMPKGRWSRSSRCRRSTPPRSKRCSAQFRGVHAAGAAHVFGAQARRAGRSTSSRARASKWSAPRAPSRSAS